MSSLNEYVFSNPATTEIKRGLPSGKDLEWPDLLTSSGLS